MQKVEGIEKLAKALVPLKFIVKKNMLSQKFLASLFEGSANWQRYN